MANTIHAQVAVPSCERCPVATLSAETTLKEVRVDPIDGRIEFVTDEIPADPPTELELIEFAGEAHGRYDLSGVDPEIDVAASVSTENTYRPCACNGLPSAFADSPVLPRETRIDDGELLISFVLTGYDELEAIVNAFDAAELRSEVRRLLVDQDTTEDDPDVIPIDLADVTERQAEVATLAVKKGYFDPDGPTAEAIADDLGLAKSTVSEHLRLVTSTVFSQLFDDDRN